MSNENVLEWLGTMAVKHGFASGAEVEEATGLKVKGKKVTVRPSEVISGASGVQYSYGENTYEGMKEGGDFASKARENAKENDHNEVYSGYKDGSNPMQSPDLGSGDFKLRYGIGFLCANYKSWSDLKDIKKLSKPKSAYLKAFKGMKKTKQYKDPKSREIENSIASWINRLSKDLKGKGTGELVVSFQGHGENGSIFGVDEKEISAGRLLAIAKAAEKKQVSLTYMLDACFSGNAVTAFQDHAADKVDERIDEMQDKGEGIVGTIATTLSATVLRLQMTQARELIKFSKKLGEFGEDLHVHVSDIESSGSLKAWEDAIKLNKKIVKATAQMQERFETKFNFGSRPEAKLDKITKAFEKLVDYLNRIRPNTCFDYSKWTGAIGKCQDELSNGANRIIKLIDKDLKIAA